MRHIHIVIILTAGFLFLPFQNCSNPIETRAVGTDDVAVLDIHNDSGDLVDGQGDPLEIDYDAPVVVVPPVPPVDNDLGDGNHEDGNVTDGDDGEVADGHDDDGDNDADDGDGDEDTEVNPGKNKKCPEVALPFNGEVKGHCSICHVPQGKKGKSGKEKQVGASGAKAHVKNHQGDYIIECHQKKEGCPFNPKKGH